MSRSRIGRRLRAAVPVAVIAWAVPASALAAHAGQPAARHIPAAHPRRLAGLLTPAQASAKAAATHKPVTVTSLTTSTSQTVALPSGGMKVTESLLPTRMLRDGTWVPLSGALHKAATGRLEPGAVASPVTLSAGGAGPLATMESYGHALSLSWAGGTLPAPSVSGSTATYANVLPGINLAVTVSELGTVSETAIVTSAAAAASAAALAPALQLAVSSPGTTISPGPDGSLSITDAGEAAAATPLFTIPAPQVWDSTAPPAGTVTTTADGMTLVAGSGAPAYSGLAGPGAFARTYQGSLTMSGSTMTVSVPAAAMSASTAYPLYVDPTIIAPGNISHDAENWTEIESGLPADNGTSSGDGTYDTNRSIGLQVGYCDESIESSCSNIGITRTLLDFPLDQSLPSDTTVYQANVYLYNFVSYEDCTAEPIELWHIPGFSSNTSWNSSASHWTDSGFGITEQMTPPAYGYTGCPGAAKDLNFGDNSAATGGTSSTALHKLLTTLVDGHAPAANLGLKAPDETTMTEWRKFDDTVFGNAYIQYLYYYPPATPVISTSPGGGCQTQAQANAKPIGNQLIDIDENISDTDGDTGMTTTTAVYNTAHTPVLEDGPWSHPGGSQTGYQAGDIPAASLPNGVYQITATTVDSHSESSGTAGCYINIESTAPPALTVTGLQTSVAYGGTLSGFTVAPTGTCTTTCPVKYTYQIGSQAPATVTANSSHDWTGPTGAVDIDGVFSLSIAGINSAGNISQLYTSPLITVIAPTTTTPDGYYSNGKYPDLITTDSSAADPSVWLSQGTGNGKLAAPVDIGSLGNYVSPGKDGPADWNGATILHGNFYLNGNDYAQDIAGYWPANQASPGVETAGNAVIVQGNYNATPLDPQASPLNPDPIPGDASILYSQTTQAPAWCDNNIAASPCNPGTNAPVDLVYAGDASQEASLAQNPTDSDDIIGVLPYTNSAGGTSYELNLYTSREPGTYQLGSYQLDSTYGELAGYPGMPGTYTGPIGFMLANLQDFTLATAQINDTADPNGDPADTVLLALDDKNKGSSNTDYGMLFEATLGGPGGSCTITAGQPCIIGQPGTWAQVTGQPAAWATSAPQLASADLNNGSAGSGSGALEIWTVASNTAAPYTISGSGTTSPALSSQPEQPGTPLSYGTSFWSLSDGGTGGPNPNAANPASAINIVGGTADPIVGSSYSWSTDPAFSSIYNGGQSTTTGSVVAPAANPVTSGDSTPSISVWFSTTATNQVLVTETGGAITGQAPGTTTTGSYDPIMYIGSDGKLNAEWWNGHAYTNITSTAPVDDGEWHHAVLTATGSSQALTIDGAAMGSANGAVNVTGTNFYIGGGYLGGGWPDSTYTEENGNTGYLTYYTGNIADVTISK